MNCKFLTQTQHLRELQDYSPQSIIRWCFLWKLHPLSLLKALKRRWNFNILAESEKRQRVLVALTEQRFVTLPDQPFRFSLSATAVRGELALELFEGQAQTPPAPHSSAGCASRLRCAPARCGGCREAFPFLLLGNTYSWQIISRIFSSTLFCQYLKLMFLEAFSWWS